MDNRIHNHHAVPPDCRIELTPESWVIAEARDHRFRYGIEVAYVTGRS